MKNNKSSSFRDTTLVALTSGRLRRRAETLRRFLRPGLRLLRILAHRLGAGGAFLGPETLQRRPLAIAAGGWLRWFHEQKREADVAASV